jgi:hypothetical protein
MKKLPIISGKELRKRIFEEERKAVGLEVDAAIAMVDAGSSQEAVESAKKVVDQGTTRVEALAVDRLNGDFQEALADARSSAAHLSELAAQKAVTQERLDALPAPSGVQTIFSTFYLLAAFVSFFTELKLTSALVDLLHYRPDDPTGRAIGAAFASSMLVFDFIFTRLGLVNDPWPLVSATEARPESRNGQGRAEHSRILKALGASAIALTLLGVAWLQVLTVIKMAPTRPIDAAVQRDHREPSARESLIVEDSTLFFSVCVLVSGGYLAAAGTKGLSLWSRRKDLEKTIKAHERTRMNVITLLDKEEKPKMAAALGNAGLPYLWLSTVSPDEFTNQLKTGLSNGGEPIQPIPPGIVTTAKAEAGVFGSSKEIELSKARMKPPPASPPRPPKSWRETVDDTIQGAA